MPPPLIELPTSGEYSVGAVDLMLAPSGNGAGGGHAPKGLFARVFYPVEKNVERQVRARPVCAMTTTCTVQNHTATPAAH
jgi:hypothetical protein